MSPAAAVLFGFVLSASATVSAQQARARAAPLVPPFSEGRPGADLPRGWQPLLLGSSKQPTSYRLVEDEGTVVLRARAEGAASGLIVDVKFDIGGASYVQFRWKIGGLIDGADNRVASKEDSPVRIVLGFAGDKSKFTFGQKASALLAKSATGRDFPYAQLIYVWSNSLPVGTVVPNPHTKRVQMIVAASGNAGVGKWQTITRNLREDFVRAFGEEPGQLSEVGVMTDTDNTGATADGWYGDIRFLASKP